MNGVLHPFIFVIIEHLVLLLITGMCKIHITDEHCGWLVAEHQPLGKFMKMVGGGTPTIGEIHEDGWWRNTNHWRN
jgi:hypothetical protein